MQKNNKIKYFLYARKSSESEDRQVASIQSQIDVLKDVAKRENLEIIDVLFESKSAKAPGLLWATGPIGPWKIPSSWARAGAGGSSCMISKPGWSISPSSTTSSFWCRPSSCFIWA